MGRHRLILTVLSVILTASVATAHAVTISVNSRASYLRTNTTGVFNDPAPAALMLNLGALGFAAGDTILIDQLGDFQAGTSFSDTGTTMGGVFSSSNILLANGNLNRVPGAIAAGVAFMTGPTFNQNLATDIPQDFRIDPEVQITIPGGALFLFVAVIDSFYTDNSDPDSDLQVSIVAAVPEPATALLLLTGAAGVIAWSRRRRRCRST